MFNHYEGWSEKDLLDLRRRLQGESVAGQVIKSSIAGVTVEKAQTAGGANKLLVLKRIQYALWLIGEKKAAEGGDANSYQNPYTSTVKRTRARYV